MILYIQPIFIPSENRYSINEQSVLSLKQYLNAYPYDIKIMMGGWAVSDELWNRIENCIITELGDKLIAVRRFDKNYGKAYVVNTLFKECIDLDFKYFLTADSDMKFSLDIKNMFERLSDLPARSEQILNKSFGVAGLNQLEHNCHLSHIYKNKYEYINRYNDIELVVYGDQPNGIGGGAMFFSKEAWIKIGGYRIMGVYAGDDAYSLIDMYHAGYSYQMVDTIAMIHPRDIDTEYNVWKVKVCQRDSYSDDRDANLEEKIKESEDFWKNRTI